MPKDNIKQRKPKGNMLSRPKDKRRRSRSNDVVPTTEGSSSPQMIASWNKWRLVEDEGTFDVLSSEKCVERDMIDQDNLPNFSPETHKDLLKSAGYEKVTDHQVISFGEKYTLFVFRLKGHDNVMWLTKSGFGDALGKNKKDYTSRFGNDAASHRRSVSKPSKPGDSDASENEDESSDTIAGETKDENDAGNDSKVVVVTDADSDDESELESENENEAQNDTQSEDDSDDDDTPDRSTPSPKSHSQSPRRSTPVSIQKEIQSKGKIIFARKDGAKLRGLIKKNNSYEIEPLKTAPAACMHHEKVPGFAPTVDKQFITGLTIYKRLDRAKYKLRGCAGFRRGPRAFWKVVILELTDEQLKEDLQDARTKANCKYTGPLLCSWSQFVTSVRNDKKDIEKANNLFGDTQIAKTLKAEGIDPKSVRHQTFGPEDSRMIFDEFRRVAEKLSEQSVKIEAITSMLQKSKL